MTNCINFTSYKQITNFQIFSNLGKNALIICLDNHLYVCYSFIQNVFTTGENAMAQSLTK